MPVTFSGTWTNGSDTVALGPVNGLSMDFSGEATGSKFDFDVDADQETTDNDQPVSWSIHKTNDVDLPKIRSLWISSDYDVTIKVNSTSAPPMTFTITAGEPLLWWYQIRGNNVTPFASAGNDVNVSHFYVTNATVHEATVKFRGGGTATTDPS